MIKKKIKKVTEAGLEEATKKPDEVKKKRSAGEVRTAMYGKDK